MHVCIKWWLCTIPYYIICMHYMMYHTLLCVCTVWSIVCALYYHIKCTTGKLGYDGPLYDRLLSMTDNMLGPSPMHVKYVSYVYDRFCIWRTNFPGPIESVISKFTCIWCALLYRTYVLKEVMICRMYISNDVHNQTISTIFTYIFEEFVITNWLLQLIQL